MSQISQDIIDLQLMAGLWGCVSKSALTDSMRGQWSQHNNAPGHWQKFQKFGLLVWPAMHAQAPQCGTLAVAQGGVHVLLVVVGCSAGQLPHDHVCSKLMPLYWQIAFSEYCHNPVSGVRQPPTIVCVAECD